MDLFFPVSKVLGFFSAPSNTLAVIVALGVALVFTRFLRAGRWLAGLGVILLFVAGLSPLGNALIVPLEQRFPLWDASRGAPTGVIVLGGAIDGAVHGRRGEFALNEAAERMTAAVELARRYPAARLVFSGGEAALVPRGEDEASAARAFLVAMGLPAERIEIEDAARNTAENATLTRRLIQPKPGERWLLVTSAWHMPRAVGCFRAAGFDVEAYPVDFRTWGWEAAGWPFAYLSDGLRRVDVASREWIGLLVYWWTGRTSALFPAP